MTIEQIFEDIKSDRVKKVILDCDTCCEIDDQYAIAYALGSPKMQVLAAYGSLCTTRKDAASFAESAEMSYKETLRVLNAAHKADVCPAFQGAPERISDQPDFGPVDGPAVQHLIKTALESDEIIYVLSTGPATDVASALLTEPAIKEKICVIWLGSTCLELKYLYEGNINQDYRAAQVVVNSGVPFLLLPACGDPGHGTITLKMETAKLAEILSHESDTCKFFRENLLPGSEDYVYWDIAAPAVLSIPEAFEFSIMPAPIFSDKKEYAFDSTRHKFIYMAEIQPERILEDAFKCILTLD